jgi:type I restriction enzyme M protein
LPTKVKKTEILFLHLFLRLLENGGRAAVIVPDGVLFGSTNAHVTIRRELVENNRLDAVVSMPSGVFRPYTGVSAAVLLFTKGAATDRVWFYDMEHDGFSLDDKRHRVSENDIPDLLACWELRNDPKFEGARRSRQEDLEREVGPLKDERIRHQETIHRLRFEEAIAGDPEAARTKREMAEAALDELQSRVEPLAGEINQLTRQFWVTKDELVENRYDFSAARYRHVERDEAYLEQPEITLDRVRLVEEALLRQITRLGELLS